MSSLSSARRTVASAAVLLWCAAVGWGCKQSVPAAPAQEREPSRWPTYRVKQMPICNLLRTSDYVVEGTLLKIGKPYDIEVSPWPGERFLVTPVEWQVVQTISVNPLVGQQLKPLPATFTALVAAGYSDLTPTKIFGVTVIDGNLFSDPWPFTSTPSGWASEAVIDAYPTAAHLIAAIKLAARQPECARRDVLAATRVANDTRRLAEVANPPRLTPRVGPDGGIPPLASAGSAPLAGPGSSPLSDAGK